MSALDKLDKRVLQELVHDSRIPLTTLAKLTLSSRERITYRLNRLQNIGVIRQFVTELDIKKMGFITASVFLTIRTKREKEFTEFIQRCPFISWTGMFSGKWNYGMDLYARTNEELDARFKDILGTFKEDIIDHRLSIYRKNSFYYEKYFGKKTGRYTTQPIHKYSLDTKDKFILKELAKNSRIDAVHIAQEIKLSAPAVASRIKHLHDAGFIKKYTLFLDLSKLMLYQYSIFIENDTFEEKNKLTKYLQEHPQVNFVMEYLGEPFLEFGIFTLDPYELRSILQTIEESHPHNRIKETFLIQKEFLSVGPPECVFE